MSFASNYCIPNSFVFIPGRYLIIQKTPQNNDFWAVGKCSDVVCEVSSWHKKITIGLLAASAGTANNTRRKAAVHCQKQTKE